MGFTSSSSTTIVLQQIWPILHACTSYSGTATVWKIISSIQMPFMMYSRKCHEGARSNYQEEACPPRYDDLPYLRFPTLWCRKYTIRGSRTILDSGGPRCR